MKDGIYFGDKLLWPVGVRTKTEDKILTAISLGIDSHLLILKDERNQMNPKLLFVENEFLSGFCLTLN